MRALPQTGIAGIERDELFSAESADGKGLVQRQNVLLREVEPARILRLRPDEVAQLQSVRQENIGGQNCGDQQRKHSNYWRVRDGQLRLGNRPAEQRHPHVQHSVAQVLKNWPDDEQPNLFRNCAGRRNRVHHRRLAQRSRFAFLRDFQRGE